MIAAVGLGVVALIALYLAFGRSFFGGSTSAKLNASPSPTPKTVASAPRGDQAMPTTTERDFVYQTTPVVYTGSTFAPDPGRNIFAFYEPAAPCKSNCPPTPLPPPPPAKTPTPAPPPPITITYVNPQGVFAGQRAFRLEVNGQKIPPDAHIYFNQTQLPTTYINEQRVVSDIPANLVAQEGSRQIILQTPDGKKYSNPMMLNVQAPPTPQFQFIGAILRARGNNDTAIFERPGKPGNFGHRLNDVIDDRFRLVSVSRAEAVVEDVTLDFKPRYRLPLINRNPAGTGFAPTKGGGGSSLSDGVNVPYDPGTFQKDIPGIPNNVPRYVPPPQPQIAPMKKDVDDNDPNN